MIRTAPADTPPKSRGIMDLAPRQGNLYAFDPKLLTVEPGWNSRSITFSPDDEDDLTLAQSIAEVGVKQPITVYMRDGVPVVTDGHRRLAATLYALDVLKAEIKAVPVQTEPKQASEADRVLSQIVRNSGKPLAPIEKANVYAKLMDLGWTEAEIAKKTGVSRTAVVEALKLRAAPKQVTDFVRSGAVSATLAQQAMREHGDEAGAALGKAVQTAQAAGKKRATAKHVERRPRAEVLRVDRDHPTFVAGVRFAIEVAERTLGEAAAAYMAELRREVPRC